MLTHENVPISEEREIIGTTVDKVIPRKDGAEVHYRPETFNTVQETPVRRHNSGMTDAKQDCPLCRIDQCVVARDEHWTVALNDDQGYLGRCFFALNRHETDVTALGDDELLTLWENVRRVKSALGTAFQPDHYNYVLLMNVQPHLHAHIIPRYGSDRAFDGMTFHDGQLGTHYDLANVHVPSLATRERIVSVIRQHLPTPQEKPS